MKRGIHQIDDSTTLITEDGEPVEIRSTARDLDRAFDRAAQWFGEPLDCGSWEASDPEPCRETVWRVRVRRASEAQS